MPTSVRRYKRRTTEQWELEGCMLAEVNYTDYAYDPYDIVGIDLSYDNAVHVAGPTH